jgi:hypothetical protein
VTVDSSLEGKLVRFTPHRWGETIARVVQVNSDVMLQAHQGSFIRELDEILEVVDES